MPDVIAVDLGGTNIRAARVDVDGNILARDKVSTNAKDGMASVVQRISELVLKLKTPQTTSVGVGTPGVPDPQTGIIRLPAVNIPGSMDFPLSTEIQRLTGLKVIADNDGNLAALGEAWKGAGVGEPVVAIFTLGTGVGGGLVIDGKVYHGHHNLVAEFGHVSIDCDGRPCGCGNKGCVERYASASALGRDAREALKTHPDAKNSLLMKLCGGDPEKAEARLVCDAAREGDPLATQLLDQCCLWLSSGMGSVINTLNPSCVVVGGGMALAGELVLSRLRRHLDDGRAFGPIWKDCVLKQAILGDDAGLLGAARMAFQSANA
jgi:glucokinase